MMTVCKFLEISLNCCVNTALEYVYWRLWWSQRVQAEMVSWCTGILQDSLKTSRVEGELSLLIFLIGRENVFALWLLTFIHTTTLKSTEEI